MAISSMRKVAAVNGHVSAAKSTVCPGSSCVRQRRYSTLFYGQRQAIAGQWPRLAGGISSSALGERDLTMYQFC
jgi:hypothetical protein